MKFIRRHAISIFIFAILVVCYRSWFSKGLLSATDFPLVYPMQLGDFGWRPFAWTNIFSNGLGGATFTSLNLDTYIHIMARFFVFVFHMSWNGASRFMFFWPFFAVGSISSWYFCSIVTKNKTWAALGTLVYMSNTYVLMLSGGGQIGLMMAYSVCPLVFAAFIAKRPWLFTSAAVMVVLFDFRFSFLVALCMAGYLFMVISRNKWAAAMKFCVVPALIVLGLHSFWLMPALFAHGLALPEGFGSPDWLKFLSWAEFSKTLALLHPNWPENIFGKTYFTRPEFILIPVMAFGSLVFAAKKQTKTLYFFALLGLVGAFLAKGANPPFAEVNRWIFSHVPLFNGFRDPTKFYLLTVFSYSVLIPCFVMQVADRMKALRSAPVVIFTVFWLFTLAPLLTGHVKGTFGRISVPVSYSRFADLASSQTDFGRTLVVPWQNRFIFQSENHPVVSARDLLQTTDVPEILKELKNPHMEARLKELAIRYVVVPEDTTNEIFVSDRKYDPALRASVVHLLDTIPFLEKKKGFDGLDVYAVTQFTGLFYTVLPNGNINAFPDRALNPVTYSVDLNVVYRPTDVLFSQRFDPNWKLWDGKKSISPKKTTYGMMRFALDSNITGQLTVHYENQRILDIGTDVSLGVLLLLALVGYLRLSKRLRVSGKVHIVFLAVIVVGSYMFLPREATKNIVNDKHIWWSPEWMRLKNPYIPGAMVASRYVGAELRFSMKGSRTLTIKASSANDQPGIVGMDISVGDKMQSMTTVMHDKVFSVTIDAYDAKRPYEVRIRQWCGGTLWPCDMAIQEIRLDNGATVLPPSHILNHMFAILGDSIMVAFGRFNAAYMISDQLGYQLHNASFFGSSVSVVSGWDSASMRYQEDIVRYKPDVIVVFLGTNDLGFGVPLSEFRVQYEKLIAGIIEGSPKSRVILIGIMRRKDFSFYQIKVYSDVIREVAREHNVSFIDPYNWLTDEDLMDVVHPAPASEQKFTNVLYESIAALLKK